MPQPVPTDMRDGAVYLVDDEAGVRHALAFLLESRGLKVATFAGGAELLAALPAQVRGCFVLDVRMPGQTGLELFAELRRRGVTQPVMFLTGHGDIAMAVDALKSGAFDFIEKPWGDNALVDRIERALAVDAATRRRDAAAAELAARLASLSAREKEVMERMVAGQMNKVIAHEMGIAMRTVEVTRARVFAKLGVRSAPEVATLLARRAASDESAP